jgi:hypothetical protein
VIPQHEILEASPLLDAQGRLTQVGWARAPLLDCNLEQAAFYPRPLRFFAAPARQAVGLLWRHDAGALLLRHPGGPGLCRQAFVYTVDFATGHYHEETLTIPPGGGIVLPRNSTAGASHFDNGAVRLAFTVTPDARRIAVTWPEFDGKPLSAEISFALAPTHESTVVVIPIRGNRFYYNRKINCLPASGWLQIGDARTEINSATCLGNLDWGRGVWEYRSFWVWASASGFLADGRTPRPQPGLRLWRHSRRHREHGDPERPRPQAGTGRVQLQRAGFQAALAHGGAGRPPRPDLPHHSWSGSPRPICCSWPAPCINCSAVTRATSSRMRASASPSTGWWASPRNITRGGDRCMTP